MNIKISETNKTLSPNGGLLLVAKLFGNTGGGDFLGPYLPSLERSPENSLAKLKGFILSFAQGAECLDDIERLHTCDDLFSRLVGRSFTAKSYGDFLRDFSRENVIGLRNSLPRFAVKLRQALGLSMDEIIFDIDSTENEQHAKKMEEVRPTRSKACALDTVQVFDSHGLIYWQDTRPGATYTSNSSSEILHHVLSALPKDKKIIKRKVTVRADSGFCNSEFMNACTLAGVKYVTVFKENMLDTVSHRLTNWKTTELEFKGQKGVEVAETVYQNKEMHKVARIVVLRLRKEVDCGPILNHQKIFNYEYYSFATNIFAHEMAPDKVIELYRGRGNAENFIKEIKYGFDLKHYPCLKFDANRVYGILAAYSHLLVRALSLMDPRRKKHFAKLTRFKLIHLACQIVRSGREVTIKFMKRNYVEVRSYLERIKNLQNDFVFLESRAATDAV